MPDLKCFACEREPTQQCARCGRPYCDEHGEDFCNVCLEPSSGVPSFTLYRGSLLALLVGAAIAVWLIVQPSSTSSGSALRPIVVTPTSAAATGNLATQPPGSPQAQTTPGTPRPGTTTTAAAGGTARPSTTTTATTGTPTTGGTTGDYVVVSGDTLSGICTAIRKPANMTVADCVAQIKSLNSLTSDNLDVDQHLKVPQ